MKTRNFRSWMQCAFGVIWYPITKNITDPIRCTHSSPLKPTSHHLLFRHKRHCLAGHETCRLNITGLYRVRRGMTPQLMPTSFNSLCRYRPRSGPTHSCEKYLHVHARLNNVAQPNNIIHVYPKLMQQRCNLSTINISSNNIWLIKYYWCYCLT